MTGFFFVHLAKWNNYTGLHCVFTAKQYTISNVYNIKYHTSIGKIEKVRF